MSSSLRVCGCGSGHHHKAGFGKGEEGGPFKADIHGSTSSPATQMNMRKNSVKL